MRKLLISSLAVALLVPSALFAAPFDDAPGGTFDDSPGGTYDNTVKLTNPLGNIDSFEELVSALLDAAFIIGLPIAVLFIVLAGARFVLARGNQTKLTAAKLNLQWTVIGIGVFFGAWTLAKIIESTIKSLGRRIMNLKSIIEEIVNLIDATVPVLAGIILLLVMVSIVRYVYKVDSSGGLAEERKAIAWGFLALFIVFSLWGILRLFRNIFIGIDY